MNIIIFDGITTVIKDVFLMLLPLVTVFLVLQFITLKLPIQKFKKIVHGLIIVFIGLVLFFQGINISFIGMGYEIGDAMGSLTNNWLIVPIGFILGFIIALAEPAVRILNNEIERITSGYINKTVVLYFLAIGVGFSLALSMLRILSGIPLWYFILPGYVLALLLIKYVSPLFVSIAFDAGGVVTGPMIATAILAITLGTTQTVEGSNPVLDGFGMIALVSLIPILSILILGVLYERVQGGISE